MDSNFIGGGIHHLPFLPLLLCRITSLSGILVLVIVAYPDIVLGCGFRTQPFPVEFKLFKAIGVSLEDCLELGLLLYDFVQQILVGLDVGGRSEGFAWKLSGLDCGEDRLQQFWSQIVRL